MSSLNDFKKAVAKSALAYNTFKQKEAAYNQALQELQVAMQANEEALEQVKALVVELDAAAIAELQLT